MSLRISDRDVKSSAQIFSMAFWVATVKCSEQVSRFLNSAKNKRSALVWWNLVRHLQRENEKFADNNYNRRIFSYVERRKILFSKLQFPPFAMFFFLHELFSIRSSCKEARISLVSWSRNLICNGGRLVFTFRCFKAINKGAWDAICREFVIKVY